MLPVCQAPSSILMPVPMRAYHPRWVAKHRNHFKPTYFDDVVRRNDIPMKKRGGWRKRIQDPLHFDHDAVSVNGGIQVVSTDWDI